MKKSFIMIIAVAVGIICLCSCTKVSEKNFVGTWRMISLQRNDNDGYGWYEETAADENRTITFRADGTYIDNYDGDINSGTWAYISSSEQLRLFGILWIVNFYENKEMELRGEDQGSSFRVFLKRM